MNKFDDGCNVRCAISSIAIGAILMAAFISHVPGGLLHRAHEAIDLCEAELPRNRECIVSAKEVPNE